MLSTIFLEVNILLNRFHDGRFKNLPRHSECNSLDNRGGDICFDGKLYRIQEPDPIIPTNAHGEIPYEPHMPGPVNRKLIGRDYR